MAQRRPRHVGHQRQHAHGQPVTARGAHLGRGRHAHDVAVAAQPGRLGGCLVVRPRHGHVASGAGRQARRQGGGQAPRFGGAGHRQHGRFVARLTLQVDDLGDDHRAARREGRVESARGVGEQQPPHAPGRQVVDGAGELRCAPAFVQMGPSAGQQQAQLAAPVGRPASQQQAVGVAGDAGRRPPQVGVVDLVDHLGALGHQGQTRAGDDRQVARRQPQAHDRAVTRPPARGPPRPGPVAVTLMLTATVAVMG